MLKLKKCYCILELARVDYHENETWCKICLNVLSRYNWHVVESDVQHPCEFDLLGY